MTTRWTAGHFIAGDVVLDFANTVYRRIPEVGADLLDTGDALDAWLQRSGMLPHRHGGLENAEAALREARSLRSLLWELFDARVDGRDVPPEAFATLLRLAQTGLDRGVAVRVDGAVAPSDVDGALAALALRAVALVLSPPARPVRTCDRCGWLFLESSRGRPRRWCSMRTCGNQAKAERFRATHS